MSLGYMIHDDVCPWLQITIVTRGVCQCVKALVYFEVRAVRLDVANGRGDTALHLAARWGYQGVVGVLMENGARPSLLNHRRETALSLALNTKVT